MKKGFTLIELMIVVAILGILAAVAIPKMAGLISRSQEGATKGNLGAVRSSLSIYYADNGGIYPNGPAGDDTTIVQDSLTSGKKYLDAWPPAHAPGHHMAASTVDSLDDSDPQTADPTDEGEWAYVSNSTHRDWGRLMVECYHTDSRGTVWTTY